MFFNVFSARVEYTFSQKIKRLLASYLLMIAFIALSVIMIKIVDVVIVDYLHFPSVMELIASSRKKIESHGVLKVAFLVPIIEEILFRLALNPKKWNLVLFSLVLSFFLFYGGLLDINFQNIKTFYSMVASLMTGFFVYKKSDIIAIYIKKHHKIFVFISIMIFGLMHVVNINPLYFKLSLFYPFFILPQIIMGYFMTNLRLKFNFFWGLTLHILTNLISLVIA